jgi:hypothetical protein
MKKPVRFLYKKYEWRVMFISVPKRGITLKIRVSEAERDLIIEKMAAANIRNREAYLRKMALDGYVVRLDLADVRKMVSLLSNSTNNLNQIARRANETRSVYESDITDLQGHYEKLWEQAEAILRSLAKVQG